jgi:putative DNA primase/helicase
VSLKPPTGDWFWDLENYPPAKLYMNKSAQRLMGPPLIAQFLAKLMRNEYGYINASKIWMHFNGQVWEEIASIFNVIRTAAEDIRDAYRKKALEDENWKKNIDNGFAGLDSLLTQNFAHLVIKNLESDTTMHRKESDFDRDSHLFNMPGQIRQLKTGEYFPNRADYLCRQIAAVNPLDDMDGERCPYYMKHLKFMAENDPEVIEYLEKLSGYILSGDVGAMNFYWMYGRANNGKSTLVNIWAHILGGLEPTSYFWQAESDLFAKTNTKHHPQAIMRLRGKRLVFVDELDGQEWNGKFLKGCISGSALNGHEMGGKGVNFKPVFKLIFTSNHKPTVNANDGGVVRRLHLMDFVNQIPETEQLDSFMERFLIPEAPYILNRMLKAAKIVLNTEKCKLALPEKFKEATTEYFGDADFIQQFIDDCTDTGEACTESYSLLYKTYKTWCMENEYDTMTSKKFGDLLRDMGHKSIKINGLRYRKKIQLNQRWKAKSNNSVHINSEYN